jgi:tripartite-type tricarboxylate transporter receptor subunit TctC
LHLAAGAAALSAVSRIAWAQAYPTRPVRVIVPFAPAGTTDIAARLMGQWLSERLGQQFVIENRPGASTTIGTEVVVRASPDGYTLLLITTASAINTTLFKLNYNFLRDIVPIAGIFRVPNVWWCIHQFPPRPFLSSLPMPRPTRARSTSSRPAQAPPVTWPANCSS